MAKRIVGERGPLPYAELIIRAGDSRPIVATLHDQGGDVELSAGNSHDVVELHVVLAIIAAFTRSIGHVRLLAEAFPPEPQEKSTGADDIPF